MKADFFKKYQLGSWHLSESNVTWSERAVQQVWFEGWLRESLCTAEGHSISIIQPGIWGQGAGPDFRCAAISYGNDKVRSGDIEVDMRPQDWMAHGHDRNPNFNNVVLHAVWELSKKRLFTATENFTHVPQVELRSQLAVDETALRNLLNENDDAGRKPLSLPGACRREFEKLGADALVNILKDAARYRLERKGRRWHLRAIAVGKSQALWETLAEGMGYYENKMAFSLLSRRARIKDLLQLDFHARSAWLFGVANLLPDAEARIKDPAVLSHLKILWSHWWKLRPNLVDSILPKDLWVKSQVRPWNQPLRRLAGLCALSDHLPSLLKALEKGDERFFTDLLMRAEDSFWNQRLSWRSKKLDRTFPLIGADRARELSINIFWPLMLSRAATQTPPSSEDPHLKRLESIRCGWNHKTRIAYDRIVPPSIKKQALENALFQQGLLQLYEDYCVRDESACANCPFPGQIAR